MHNQQAYNGREKMAGKIQAHKGKSYLGWDTKILINSRTLEL